MKLPKPITNTLIAGLLATASTLTANTTILENADFSSGYDSWNIGSNLFVGGTWQQFVSAPDAYTYASRLTTSGGVSTFVSWDDGASDRIETFLYQEFGAGPVASATPTEFETGDVIVFKGTARGTVSGTDPSDVTIRAFIKTLGYNSQGWEFQTLPEYSQFYPITSTDGSFELKVTYPDIVAHDNLQVLQLGFEISTEYDGAAMDSGTIVFSNLEGYIEGEEQPATWRGYAVDANGWANTNTWMGWVWTGAEPWVLNAGLGKYVYAPGTEAPSSGDWVYIPK